MAKKSFLLIVVILIVTFALTLMIKYYRPVSGETVSFDDFPLQLGDWTGKREQVSKQVIDLLNPKDIFSATYVNSDKIGRAHV